MSGPRKSIIERIPLLVLLAAVSAIVYSLFWGPWQMFVAGAGIVALIVWLGA